MSRKFLAILVPGLVTGAAETRPIGARHYTIAWSEIMHKLVLWELLINLRSCGGQICRQDRVWLPRSSGHALRKNFPRWWSRWATAHFVGQCHQLIGSDLAGMADSAQMFPGSPPIYLSF